MTTPTWEELRTLPLSAWTPRQQLVPPATEIHRPSTPAIDIHNHLGRWLTEGDWRAGTAPWMVTDPGALIGMLDEAGVDTIVNLDGMWGEELSANVARYDVAFPSRVLTFCQLDWSLISEPDGVARLAASLDDSVARGARGVKVWKTLGLGYRDAHGALILPDDPRVVAVLQHAGSLGLPVLIHTADPKAFFEPLDEHNERLDELMQMREWWFGDRAVHPTFARLLGALNALIGSCPDTRFIGAHMGCDAEDLDLVERMLDAHPHYSVDIAGRMAELGRQPRRARALIERHPDRVHFGTDVYPATVEQYRLHYRFLETADEAFEYAPGSPVPPQGRWAVSALELDAEILSPVYQGNARRVLGL